MSGDPIPGGRQDLRRARRWSPGAVLGAVLVAAALLGAGCAESTGSTGEVPEYDLLLRGGTIVDGTGAPRFTADVGIQGSRIVAVGHELAAANTTRVIDCAGLVIAPGFWDNHAHLVDLEDHPQAENFIRQGVTTILASLHSQDQIDPIDVYRDRVEMAPNVGLFAGHTWIRRQVMGLEDREPSTEELERMRAMVTAAMEQGALGLSTGLEYVPAAYASMDEVVALAEVAAAHDGIYVTHMRDEGIRVLESIRETLEVGRRAGLPIQINHLKVTGAELWGTSEEILGLLDGASDTGQAVAFDVYPYTAFSTYSDLMFPAWALADGPEAFAARVAEPSTRARLVDEMRRIFPRQTGPGPDSILFREVPARPGLAGSTLADYLEGAGSEVSVVEAVEALIELQLEGGFIGVFYGMSEEDVRRFVQHPEAMFETDGDLVEPGVGHPHPRSYGSFPRILSQYVNDEGLLTLEEAVRRMTSLPAAWYRQPERGRVATGQLADLVIFDAEEVSDRSRYTDPHHYPVGIIHVLVNGELVLLDSAMTGALPGRFLARP